MSKATTQNVDRSLDKSLSRGIRVSRRVLRDLPACAKNGNDGWSLSRSLLRSIRVNLCDSADVSNSSLLCNCFMCSKKLPMRILLALFRSSSMCIISDKRRDQFTSSFSPDYCSSLSFQGFNQPSVNIENQSSACWHFGKMLRVSNEKYMGCILSSMTGVASRGSVGFGYSKIRSIEVPITPWYLTPWCAWPYTISVSFSAGVTWLKRLKYSKVNRALMHSSSILAI